jgi:hypothetical protein
MRPDSARGPTVHSVRDPSQRARMRSNRRLAAGSQKLRADFDGDSAQR